MRHSVYETAMKIDSLPDPLNLGFTETYSNGIKGISHSVLENCYEDRRLANSLAVVRKGVPDPLNLVYTETCLDVIEGSVTRSSTTAMNIDADPLPNLLNLVYTEMCSNVIEGSVTRSSRTALKIDGLPILLPTSWCFLEPSIWRKGKGG